MGEKPLFSRILRRGMTGPDVALLQVIIKMVLRLEGNREGEAIADEIKPDGEFGENTEVGLAELKKVVGMTQDEETGEFGQVSMEEISSYCGVFFDTINASAFACEKV